MKNYIVFEQNGQITKTGICNDKDFLIQGKYVIEGIANDATQYIKCNEIVNMPLKPEGAAYFDYETYQWVLDYTTQNNNIISQRDFLLYQSDWTQIPNNPLTSEVQNQWAIYRQELRDVTSQSGYPFNVIWPTPPQG
jgi:hypothetical protein